MNLKYDISPEVKQKLNLRGEERIYYSIPYDVSDEGKWISDGMLIVTTLRVVLVRAGEVEKSYDLKDIVKTRAEVTVGGGMLIARMGEKEQYITRYSAKHRTRYAYIARGMNILSRGRSEEVESKEKEKICPTCHRALSESGKCPHCDKQGGFFKNFMKMIEPYWERILWINVLMLLAAGVTLANPHLQRILVDDVLKKADGDIRMGILCLFGMFVLGAGIVVINVAKSYYCTRLGARIAKDIRERLFDHLQKLPLQFVNDRRPGELMNRVVNDTGHIREFMQDTFCNMFTVAFIFVAVVLYMLYLNWKMALLSFLFVPVGVWMTMAFRKSIHRRFHLQYLKEDDVSSNLQDVLSGMRVVKSYGKEEREKDRFNELSDEYARVAWNNERFWALFNPAVHLTLGSGVFLVLLYGGSKVINEEMTAGMLMQFMTYTTMLYQYVQWMTNMPRQITNLIASMERINDVMNQEEYGHGEEASEKIEIVGKVEFQHASFGYKSYEPVLEDINLTVKPGEMIGIVGPSGAGKSTLINLLMGLYEIDDGALLIDGVPIEKLEREHFHQQIGVVLQETFLFSGTILNNIRFAKPDATYEEVVEAAKLANAHEFISKMADGYNTYVGEKGFTLSGGERQRIAIARAILTQPKLLILDEATASLDTESEFMIQQALERLISGRTTFAIAHRLSTLKNADRLIVIDDHKIAEAGTHEELVEQKGLYYRLVKAQLEMQASKGA